MAKTSKPPKDAAPSVVELQQAIRAKGLRSTSSRVAVLARLNAAAAPLTHSEIFDAVAHRGFDRVTVYRNLIDLTEVGLVTRSDVGDHVWRFELKRATRGHSADHPHFVCTDCGDVSCLPDVDVRVVGHASAPKALATKRVEVQIKGLCDDCT
jgi:Fur family ferric uptake transcriptional regulator